MDYRNARYIDDQGRIDCEINHPKHGWIPYTLDPTDTDMTINNDDLLAAMEQNGDVTPYAPPSQEALDEQAATTVREERNIKLVYEVDTIAGNALRWAALTEAKRQEWSDYRQALLDVPQQTGFPHDVVWPTKPE